VNRFTQTVVCDFEYEVTDGDLPNVLCMVAYVLDENRQHVRTIRLWRGEFGRVPPFDTGPDTLFVAYSAWADLTCFMALDWRFPEHVFDLHTAYLAATNILLPYDPDAIRKKQSKRLPDACRSYGVEGWENIDKGTIAKDIGEGRWHIYGLGVCTSIVRRTFALPHTCLNACWRAARYYRHQTSISCCIGAITARRPLRKYRRGECRSIWRFGIRYRKTRQ
jgi:hypothetical protein